MIWVLLASLTMYSSPVTAWQVQIQEARIRTEPACKECRIELRTLTTLRPDVSLPPHADPRPFSIRRQRGTGHYVVVGGDRTISLHDSSASPAKVIGRRGRGPGEFWAPQLALSIDGDTILIIDPYTARLSVMTPRGDFLTSFRFLATPPLDALILATGDLVVNAVIRHPDHVGYPLHIVSRDGQVIRSFGTDRPDFRFDGRPTWRRRIAGTNKAGLWVAREREYVLEHWNLETGQKLAVLRRPNSWLPKGEETGYLPTPARPPQGYIGAVRLTQEHLLWVLVVIPDNEWRRGLSDTPVTTGEGVSYYPETDYDRLYDTVIEVIDTRSGRVVASRRVDQYLYGFADEQHLIGYRESDDGEVLLDVFVVTLAEPSVNTEHRKE